MLLNTCACVRVALIALALTASAVGSAPAEDALQPTKEAGHALARRLCSACHLIGGGEGETATAGIPPFPTIANRPGQTAERILNVLMRPHLPMPDMQLTSFEMQSILAYLESLRTDPSIPPLSPGPAQPKPLYPEPS